MSREMAIDVGAALLVNSEANDDATESVALHEAPVYTTSRSLHGPLRRRMQSRSLVLGAAAAIALVGTLSVAYLLHPGASPAWRSGETPLQRLLAVRTGDVCFDGRYFGESGMTSFFVGFGTQWNYFDSFGGMLSTSPRTRDKAHHKSVLRSLPFNVTSRTTFSLTTKGGRSDGAAIKGSVPDLSGPSFAHGFVGVAVRSMRTSRWEAVKSRTKGGEEEEVVTFTPEDLKGLVGEQVTVDVVDTRSGLWGWIAVDGFVLHGSCSAASIGGAADSHPAPAGPAGQVAGAGTTASPHLAPLSGIGAEEAAWAHHHLGNICTFLNSAEDMATFFNAMGTVWEWQMEDGGAMFNTAPTARDSQHQKSILRSIPFTIDRQSSISATTVGGVGVLSSVEGLLANYSGVSSKEGFLGIAIRSVSTDHWVLSKRRQARDVNEEEVLEFGADDLARFIGQQVTLDVIDAYSGDDGWIGLRNFRLRGPCVHIQFKPKPTQPPTTSTRIPVHTIDCSRHGSDAKPSLFCFSVMSPPEVKIIGQQFTRKASIFACNDYTVISTLAISIGKDACGADVYTWHNDVDSSHLGDTKHGAATSSFLNTKTFLLAWDSILASDKWQRHDFIAKADPDCVFFPERLRVHLNPYVGKSVFFLNCNALDGRMYGAMEVFSTPAIQKYKDNVPQCKNMDWKAWGEDLYMESCMRGLGVEAVKDYKQVGDDRCIAAPCTDASRAAFHPFKDEADYWKCWSESGSESAA